MRTSSINTTTPLAPSAAQSDIVISPDDACDIRLVVAGNECNKYPAKQHAQRVARWLRTFNGLIYLQGQPTVNWIDSDQPRPFRQRRYFYYLSGVEEPDCCLTYDLYNDVLTLYIPDFDLHRAIWMGPTLTLKEARAKYDVDRVRYYSCLPSDIARWACEYNSKSSPIFVLHDSQAPSAGAVESMGLRLDVERLLPAMDAARGIKDEHEIQLIRRANEVSALAHRWVLENIHKMSNEAEIEALFLDTCIANGAKNQAYEIIAGSGENAATLHYVKNNEPLKGRQLVCLDAGAEWNCYASDVTRTFPLTGYWPSAEARDIYHVVQTMQEECIKRIRRGVRFLDLHVIAHIWAIRGLMQLGILKGGDEFELRESGVSRIFFPHGLGHHVGLEVHDVSEKPIMAQNNDYSMHSSIVPTVSFIPCTAIFSATPLEEGMVVTVEPGIYFSRYALANAKTLPIARYIDFEVAERYIPIGGVRIEDDILVTAHGYENLTTAPKGEEMLEIIRNGGRK